MPGIRTLKRSQLAQLRKTFRGQSTDDLRRDLRTLVGVMESLSQQDCQGAITYAQLQQALPGWELKKLTHLMMALDAAGHVTHRYGGHDSRAIGWRLNPPRP